MAMWNYLLVACGGALGSVARVWAASWMTDRAGAQFPWGTLLVNVSGSLVIGVIAGWSLAEGRFSPGARNFLMAGFCGGYTTFSAFSLQTLALLQQKQHLLAMANAVLSFVLCLLAVWLGHVIGAAVSGSKAS
jgi:CrcB protein